MKTFIVSYDSNGNVVIKKTVVIRANSLSEAQDRFFEWLRKHPIYPHMWQLTISVKQIDDFLDQDYDDNWKD
jgi:hypothetical protein